MQVPDPLQENFGSRTPLPNVGSTLVDQISEWISERIITGAFQPGQELNIRQLAQELGVSPTPVREVLRSLHSEGLVELAPRRSARVSTLTKKDVLDIYSCRAYLNGLAARLASEHMTPQVLETLQQLYDQMTEATHKNDVQGYFSLTVKTNEVILECAGNQVLKSLVRALGRRTLRLRYLSITTPGRVQVGLEFHRNLLDAFREGDIERAEQMMMQQILSARDILLKHHFDNDSSL